MAATDPRQPEAAAPSVKRSGKLGNIVMAALAVQAAVPMRAHAESAPEQGVISLRYLHYQDQQKVQVPYPDYTGSEPKKLKRVTAKSPSVYLLAPIGTQWSLEASAVQDDVSGATPKYYTDVSGASVMEDKRRAGDIKLSRHFSRGGLSLGYSHSTENDYKSNAVSFDARISTEDNNTTFNFGYGHSDDTINPVNAVVVDAKKRTNEFMLGITQALTTTDLVQLNLTHSNGRGYYTDPYKRNDKRPDQRQQSAVLARWNHHFAGLGATSRTSYRYYKDSFGVTAHTAELAWVQPLSSWFIVTPEVRYYTQSSANFYYDPVMDVAIYPRPIVPQTYSTVDQRMAAFGAITGGLKLEVRIDDWTADAKYEHYEQRGDWRAFGKGSPNLDIFSADSVQLGLSKRF